MVVFPTMNNRLLQDLNDKQCEAVSAPMQNLLILAGAGSGKTRVLVHRIAWLMEQENVSPFAILAVTFTNKAAAEMRTRIESLLGTSVQGMWVGTFHSLAHRLLRTHWQDAGLPQTFQIIDSEDQFRLIKRIMRELNIDDERVPPKQAQWFINGKKDEGLRSRHCSSKGNHVDDLMLTIYAAYEDSCDQSGSVDFAELLLRSHELWLNHPELLQHYQNRFNHILVDEFQDTNAIQYAWIKLLAGKDNKVMVVGDDDQSIYSWRGACVDNIHTFQKDYANVHSISLEQNYRSTSTILNAANALISGNEGRFGKNLWTAGSEGDPIRLYTAYNEIDEARFIADELIRWREKDGLLRDIAILYRSNAQSRVLEEALIQKNVAYRIYGGFRFFERAEIKDALAYIRLMCNDQDNPSFERIVNVPTRGIGNKTVEIIREQARNNNQSLWEASLHILENKLLTARATNALQDFVDLILHLKEQTDVNDIAYTSKYVIENSGLLAHYQKEKGESGRARIENLKELINAASEFNFDDIDEEEKQALTPLTAFLSHAALEAGDKQAEATQDCVKLMTLHAAKGLEFPMVILCGMEEGLFPHQMSMQEPGRLEEERRLCYVGMTRAMKQLILTYAESRRLYGREMLCQASRFLREIPQNCLQEIRLNSRISRPASITPKPRWQQQTSKYRIGQSVCHPTFGDGIILDVEENGEKTRINIQFGNSAKWLLASVAKLEIMA